MNARNESLPRGRLHCITLSNGRKLILEEDDNRVHIALGADDAGDNDQDSANCIDSYICMIDRSGVHVMCNSGDSPDYLTTGLSRR